MHVHLVWGTLRRQRLINGEAGYGAFTISSEEVQCVERYVLNQKMHPANNALEPNLESGGG